MSENVFPPYTAAEFISAKDQLWLDNLTQIVNTVRESMQRGESSRQVQVKCAPSVNYRPLVKTFLDNDSNITGFTFTLVKEGAQSLLISWVVDV